MTHLPEVERALLAAARRADQRESVDRSPASRRRGRLLLVSGALVLAVAGGAVAADGLLTGGDPVPKDTHPSSLGTIAAGSDRVLRLRAADPDGGPAWAMRAYRTSNAPLVCLQVARAQDGRLGVIGRDHVFGNDGRFHELPPDALQGGACGAVDADGQAFLNARIGGVSASGYTGPVPGAVGGCRRGNGETKPGAERVPRCSSQDSRHLFFGLAGAAARSVELRVGDETTTVVPDRGESGAYLLVLRSSRVAGKHPRLRVTYASGETCEIPSVDAESGCSPPPGF